jgi:hypothetical protein
MRTICIVLLIITAGYISPAKAAFHFTPVYNYNTADLQKRLNLSLSYDIVVKGHGGNITVDTKECEGLVFTIYLPIS